jgi:uncharacterized membrane protein
MNLALSISEFFEKYYLQPLGKYYTLPATITYALLFVVALYLVYKLCKRLKLKFDEKLITALLPFVVLGGVIRALRDAEILYKSFLFVSPPLYFFVFGITLFSLLAAKEISKHWNFNFEKNLLLIGIGILLPHAFLIRIVNVFALGLILLIWGVSIVAVILMQKVMPKYFTSLNSLAIASQMLDATSAFVSIEFFGYGEQHVLSSFLMQSFGTWIFLPVKFFASLCAVILIDKYCDDKDFANYLKFAIITLGLALGTRNTLRVAMMV